MRIKHPVLASLWLSGWELGWEVPQVSSAHKWGIFKVLGRSAADLPL